MSELLTDSEMLALRLTGQVWDLLAPSFSHGPDATEFVSKIHDIQHTIMARAAARAYPDELRLSVAEEKCPKCEGSGKYTWDERLQPIPCPAGCENPLREQKAPV